MRKQKKIKIGDRKVGDGEPCFIIAEAGVNHNGDLLLAKKLIDAAKFAGADAIKFQTFKTEGVVVDNAPMAEYQQKNTGKKSSQKEMLKKLELKYEDFCELKDYCDDKDIIFLSTPHSFDAIDFLEPLVPAYKFGSGDLTNTPALEYAAKKGKPIIIGTGMSTLKEVKTAVDAINRQGNKEVVVLHCTTSYPCKLEEVNLRAMLTLRKELNCLVGYSDHTLGINVPIMAATLGATIIEKHFTLDKSLPGPDHKASLNPAELKEMVKGIRDVEKILGSEEKKPTYSERKIMTLVRKSVVAAKNIPQGTKIIDDMLAIKRPGTGIIPREIKKIVGKTAKRHIKKDELIGWHMLR
jgi:N,N'-diacetyllegionaminate synthase